MSSTWCLKYYSFPCWQDVLHLTLKAVPFQVMVNSEKKMEFREKSKWIKSRLIDSSTGEDKQYDRILFVNGYGAGRPVASSEQ